MKWSFTAGAERALAEASGWTSGEDRDDLGAPELLLGLLAEEECRAAQWLLASGVDSPTVTTRWPTLRRSPQPTGREFSPGVGAAFEAALDRLWEYPRPLFLATEHVLLGLVVAPGEMAVWLTERGVDSVALEAQIHQWYGHQPGALPVEAPGEESAPPRQETVAPPTAETPMNHSTSAAVVSPEGLALSLGVPPRQDTIALVPTDKSNAAPVPLLRLLDAAANRAREGLRVVEDFVRMVLDDRYLTGELKELRHELQKALQFATGHDLLASRETLADVGTTLSTSAEFVRLDMASVAAANWKRLQEALRSLEEYAKVLAPAQAAVIERLRYRSYTLERATAILHASLDRLALVRLCVLVDGRGSAQEFELMVDQLIAGGAHMIQLRDKRLPDGELLGRAKLLQARAGAAGVLSIINDRADIAAAAHADGVHVGQDDLPVKGAREIVGPRALVGLSTHSIEQAQQAVLAGANYIGVGPTFPSSTKQFEAFPGLDLLRAVAAEIRLPAFAIGGIGPANVDTVLATGISRVAVSGAIVAAPAPAAVADAMARQLGAGKREA